MRELSLLSAAVLISPFIPVMRACCVVAGPGLVSQDPAVGKIRQSPCRHDAHSQWGESMNNHTPAGSDN